MSAYEDHDRGIEVYETAESSLVFDVFYDDEAQNIADKGAHILSSHARLLTEAGTPTARFRELLYDEMTLWFTDRWLWVWGGKVRELCSTKCKALLTLGGQHE